MHIIFLIALITAVLVFTWVWIRTTFPRYELTTYIRVGQFECKHRRPAVKNVRIQCFAPNLDGSNFLIAKV